MDRAWPSGWMTQDCEESACELGAAGRFCEVVCAGVARFPGFGISGGAGLDAVRAAGVMGSSWPSQKRPVPLATSRDAVRATRRLESMVWGF